MRRPSFQFYPADWRNNANLRRCSPAARGIWVDVLCVLHDSDEYGLVRWPLADLANSANAPIKLIKELVEKRVLKGDDKSVAEAFIYTPRSGRKDGDPITLVAIQPGPVWYSSRMVKDEYVRTTAGATTRFGQKDGAPKAERRTQEGTDRAKLRAKVLEKAGGHCVHCKVELGDVWEIDHFIPRAKGGRHIFSNLVASCRPCNQDKSDTLPDDWSAPSRSPTQRQGEDQSDGSTSSSSSTPTVNTVPIGTDGDAVKPSDLTKAELWAAGKSLLRTAGMPEAQCGSFVGKLCKDYGDAIVIDAVRSSVVQQPADPASYLKSECLRLNGQRPSKSTGKHAGFQNFNYREGVTADGTLT